MNILVLNAGSGSQQLSLHQIEGKLPSEPLDPLWHGLVDSTSPGLQAGQLSLTIHCRGRKPTRTIISAGLSRKTRLKHLLESLWGGESAIIQGPEEVDVIGHRVVHGGTQFKEAVWVDAQVRRMIKKFGRFAPLHNPINLEGMEVARKVFGKEMRQVAVFDTSFHQTIKESHAIYPGPFSWIKKGIRRYGFHGTSFRWVSRRMEQLLGRKGNEPLRLLICHLGGGCSLAATVGGKSVDTTMGFTPLDGIAMCTRSGALDPGILLFLLERDSNLRRLSKMLHKECGLTGLSGLPGDTRVIRAAARRGDRRAQMALDVFVHRLQAGIAQMMASLSDWPDALVFTDAIGQSEPGIRSQACEVFHFLGVRLDQAKNRRSPLDAKISTPASRIPVYIVKSREDWQIACDCYQLYGKKSRRQGGSYP